MKKYRTYSMTALAYWRAEWTDISDDDKEFAIKVTEELDDVIKKCYKSKINAPNAAKEIAKFFKNKARK